MKILTKVLLTIGFMFTGVVATAPETAFASTACTHVVGTDGKWYTEGAAQTSGGLSEAPANCKAAADNMIGKILRFVTILSALVIVAAVGMIIYGGFKYITSQGDPKQTESAKQQIWYAGVGLFIVLTAFTILQLFKNASGF